MTTQVLVHTSVLLLYLLIPEIAVATPPLAKPGCKDYCGNVSIPFPFGIGFGCYLNEWYNISCDESSSPPKIFLTSIDREVLEISLEGSNSDLPYIRIKSPIFLKNCGDRETNYTVRYFTDTPFFFSFQYNLFVAVGNCINRAVVETDREIVGCKTSDPNGSCNGNGWCTTKMPPNLRKFNVTFEVSKEARESKAENKCNLAFLVEDEWFLRRNRSITELQSVDYVPALLTWGIAGSEGQKLRQQSNKTEEVSCYEKSFTYCRCESGYEGNPYLPNGCQDVDECKRKLCPEKETCVNTNGSYECLERKDKLPWVILAVSLAFVILLLLFIGGWWLSNFLKKKRKIKHRKKFFKQILQQQTIPSEDCILKTKLFNLKELLKATDHFNKNRILGKGGQGTVYKGMLVDGRIVAIKKSIAMNANNIEEFINEVVILSQINHRNVVKLLGCCLDTEVPLLVYEFISNGTLFQYLHDQTEEFHLTWEMRLRIAIESAEAISYLHSSASIPIYHRDIKSKNILLDEKCKAKVSDFGLSRSLAIDQTHLSTNVKGTFGYLDPEYFHSGRFTEKSDVYSFGVVLVELITGEKPISLINVIEEELGLATHFVLLMKENRLFDIVDARITQECVHKEIMAVAKLACSCLSLSGKKRPTMKEVADELKRITSLQKGSNAQQTHEELEYVMTDLASYNWETAFPSTSSTFNTTIAASSLEMHPLIE